MRISSVWTAVLVLGALAWLASSLSLGAPTARTLWVANNGLDSVNCGARSSPCRSITQCMINARDGDTIQVGAGRYGDLNDDGQMGGPGEERFLPRPDEPLPGNPLDCAVCVRKSLAILSIHGAAETVISGVASSIVELTGDGITFGTQDHGFTIIGSPFEGGFYGLHAASRGGKVGGNTVTGTGSGFLINAGTIENNLSLHTHNAGFVISGQGTRILNNAADHTQGSSFDEFSGFLIGGSGHVVEGNRAIGNRGPGFTFQGSAQGVTATSFRHNTVTGNLGAGVALLPGSKVNGFSNNNIFGNGSGDVRLAIFIGSDYLELLTPNCGIFNATGNIQQAKDNFWGSAGGPGPDPADSVGPDCVLSGSRTLFKPFASEFQ